MNYKKCNAQLNDEDVLCSVCGEKTNKVKEETNIKNIKEPSFEPPFIDFNPNIRRKKGKWFLLSGAIVLVVASVILYNFMTISNKDIDKVLSSMDNRKITKILNKIDDEQIQYFEQSAQNIIKEYLLSLGYDYSSEDFIMNVDENFANDLSIKLSFLDNPRLNKAGLMYDIKYYADTIVSANKSATEIDFDKVNKFFDLEEKSCYIKERLKSDENPNEYTNLYYAIGMDMDFLIEEDEEGVIPKGELVGSFIYERDEDIMQDGFAKRMPVYTYYSLEEVQDIQTEYYKIDMDTHRYMEELQTIIVDFLNKK